ESRLGDVAWVCASADVRFRTGQNWFRYFQAEIQIRCPAWRAHLVRIGATVQYAGILTVHLNCKGDCSCKCTTRTIVRDCDCYLVAACRDIGCPANCPARRPWDRAPVTCGNADQSGGKTRLRSATILLVRHRGAQ